MAASERALEGVRLAQTDMNPRPPVRISVIIPAYNCPRPLRACLASLVTTPHHDAEIIVVDDGSDDETGNVSREYGVRLLRAPVRSGPAAARNLGAREATGGILFFIDADVVVQPDMLRRVVETFESHPGIDALFGSYDGRPAEPGAISQYRNLLHHFVHQHGNADASTFWAGCGAIRTSVFAAVGGFDSRRFPEPSIEDIELGYRLRSAGHRIFLDKQLQGTHLKRWTLTSMIWTDFRHRALPWSQLMLERHTAPDDLNLRRDQRVSVALTAVALLCLVWSMWHMAMLVGVAAALTAIVVTNRQLYTFFRKQRGLRFAAMCVPLHFVYFVCSGLGYSWARLTFRLNRRGSPFESACIPRV